MEKIFNISNSNETLPSISKNVELQSVFNHCQTNHEGITTIVHRNNVTSQGREKEDKISKNSYNNNNNNNDDTDKRLVRKDNGQYNVFYAIKKSTLVNEMRPSRENLITTALNFLQNAKVRQTPLKQKLEFLKAKGLSKTEIEVAFQRLNTLPSRSREVVSDTAVINMDINTAETHTQWALQPSATASPASTGGKLPLFSRIRDLLQSINFFGVIFAIFTLFKKILFRTRKKSTDETLSDMDKKVNNRISELQRDLAQVKISLTHEQHDQTERFMLEFQQFKTDLQAIKGLLLNRKNFSVPVNAGGHHHHLGSSISGGLPAWQLSAECSRHHSALHHTTSTHSDLGDPIVVVEGVSEKESGLVDDAGSGSGSSETEVVTKNSDSSLEIM